MAKMDVLINVTIELDADSVEQATKLVQQAIVDPIKEINRTDNRLQIWTEITEVSEIEENS